MSGSAVFEQMLHTALPGELSVGGDGMGGEGEGALGVLERAIGES